MGCRSLVIDTIQKDISSSKNGAALGYIYFDHRSKDQLSPTLVIRSLARQVISQHARIPPRLLEQCTALMELGKPDLKALGSVLLEACAEHPSTCIVVDALDECEEQTYRKGFLQFLDRLRAQAGIRTFLTSRLYPMDVQKALAGAQKLQIEAHDADIRRYINQRIDEDPMADLIEEDFKAQLVEKLIKKAQGLSVVYRSNADFVWDSHD